MHIYFHTYIMYMYMYTCIFICIYKRFHLIKDSNLPLEAGKETCRVPTNLHGVDRSVRSTSRHTPKTGWAKHSRDTANDYFVQKNLCKANTAHLFSAVPTSKKRDQQKKVAIEHISKCNPLFGRAAARRSAPKLRSGPRPWEKIFGPYSGSVSIL